MVVYTLGSDSGFGIGHDGIPDDFDEETGISVILWCIIFVFLLIVTIWFYITQLMPQRISKCEIDDDDEDERIANRLLDPKTVEKSYYEFPSCQPSTSNENSQDYELIDGEIRIHYSNYEREASSNGNKAEPPKETAIPRRRSMEEMSLIFPGFLPIISEEEEEECEENIDLNKNGNVYKSRSSKDDTVKDNVNTIIEQGNSSESSNFDSKDTLFLNSNETCVSINSSCKGKQSVGNATTELRRRNVHIENDRLALQTQANENNVMERLCETAVEKDTSNSKGSSKEEKRVLHTNLNIKRGDFISGSHDSDLEHHNIANPGNLSIEDRADTLIIAKELTVALEIVSLDANENAVNITSNDNRACAKPSAVCNNNSEIDSVSSRKSNGVIEEICPVVSKDATEHIYVDNELEFSDCERSSNMADQLTHAWTFYAVSDETAIDITGNREGCDQIDDECKEIPDIVVDLYPNETKHVLNDSGIPESSFLCQMGNESMDAFETDIDVDDIDLDDLGDDPEGDLNCFFKRHVSVTDLDKILSSQEVLNDGPEQRKDELNKDNDLDEIMRGLSESVGETNKRTLISSTGDQKPSNDLEISLIALKNELVSNNTIIEKEVYSYSESAPRKVHNYNISDRKSIKQERNVQLTNKQQNSNVNCVSSDDKNEQLSNFSMRDPQYDNVEKKPLEMVSHVESYINTTKNAPVGKNGPINAKKDLKTGVYSHKTNSEDIAFLESKRSMKFQVDNSSNIAGVDVHHSNVKNIEKESRAFTLRNSKDMSVKEETKKTEVKVDSEKVVSRERKVGLTVEELSKIDLTRPVSSSSRDEIIIGKKKLRKDSGSTPFTATTSRHAERHERTAISTDHVTQSLEPKKPEGNDFYKTKLNDFVNGSSNLPSTKISRVEKDSKLLFSDSQYYVEKRPVKQRPTIEKSVVLIPDKKELQTRITIKDIPDTNIGLEISTNRPLVTKQKKTSTGLEKAEEIVPSRMKRLENKKTSKDITCTVSNERQIDWDNLLVDGLALNEVSTQHKTLTFEHNDIELTPMIACKPSNFGNKAQVMESLSSQTLCPREIDWEWFEREDKNQCTNGNNKHSLPSFIDSAEVDEHNASKSSHVYDVNDNVELKGTDISLCANNDIEDKEQNKEKSHERYTFASSSSINKSKDNINENKTIEKEHQKSASTEVIFDDNDVFSNSSRQSQEPEFPVRLTKSFSELRNVELSSQSRVGNSSFGHPDRSKSQTDVFQRQESLDEVFEDPEENVFTTRITFDEVYKNKRRIVILNVRKKSQGKTRWRSLTDLESARKHVFRFNSIGSLPEESVPTGDSTVLSSPQNKEAIFAVGGREQPSKDLHNNDSPTHAPNPKSLKQTVNRPLNEMDLSMNSKSQQEFPQSKLKQSDFTTIEQSLRNPTSLSEVDKETSLKRQSSLSPTLDMTKEDPSGVCSVPSSGTMFAVSSHSPTPLEVSSKGEGYLKRQSSLSPVMNGQGSNRRPSSGTLFAVSRHSPTRLKDSETEVGLKELEMHNIYRSPSTGTIFAVSRHSPTPSADSEVDNVLRRQQSLSPVRDIAKSRSPSGRVFAVSRHSPSSLKDSTTEKYLLRQSSLSPIQNVFQRNSSHRSSGTIFAVSRHSPTPLSDAMYFEKRPLSPPFANTALSARTKGPKSYIKREDNDHKQLHNENSEKKYSKEQSMVSALSSSRTSSQGKSDEERLLHREVSSSPELRRTNQDSSSRRSSSASSGYGGSRISPTSSLDWRHKASKPTPSPELAPQYSRGTNSRCCNDSRRISPTLSTDSECSNIDERKHSFNKDRHQREVSRSGTVFAISRYSSGASDNESPRADSRSVSPRGNEQQHSATSVQKEDKQRSLRERDNTHEPQSERNHKGTKKIKEKSSSATITTEQITNDKETQVKTNISRSSSSELENDFRISDDGWLINGDNQSISYQKGGGRRVIVTDLDSLLNGTNSTSASGKTSNQQLFNKSRGIQPLEVSSQFPSSKTTGCGVQETDLDTIFSEGDRSSREDISTKALHNRRSSEVETMQGSKVIVTTTTTDISKHTVRLQSQEAVSYSSPCHERTVFNDLDEDVFKTLTAKPKSRDHNEMYFSSDADSETSSLSSVSQKPKIRNHKVLSDAMKSTPLRLPSDSSSATPSTPEKNDPQLMFFHRDLTTTPEAVKTVEITTTNSSSRETAKESRQEVRQDKGESSSSLTDSSYGATQVKIRSKSESQSISTEVQKSAFTPVHSRTKNRRSISQECILDGSTIGHENITLEDNPTFKEMADSHKSMPDLLTARETTEVDVISEKTPYHSRLSAHTRLWLSQTAGIDTSNLCKDESVGSEIFLFPSKRFQPGRNVDASFLSIASDTEDISDDVSTRPSSPMSEFSFSGETPFGGKFDDDVNIIACGHHLCGQEEVIRGREKTSFTSCPSCYTYYCSRECRQAHWREHKKSCFFGRINSYMRSFIYFCHKKENLKLLLSNIAVKNYASKGRGCVMVTFASPKQARKFMTSGCVLLPSPPSYPTVRELMREGVVSKHKVNLVHLVKDYDPKKEFVLNMAVVAGRLDDLPRNPVPRHKLNTVLECIKVPLSTSVMEPSKTVPVTTKETRVFYLPKCSRHEFINDMEARRHYCRNISKSLKSYGIRLKKDYPDAYESLCLYVEKNVPFKPLTVYGNEGSKIITCRIMPEASISAV